MSTEVNDTTKSKKEKEKKVNRGEKVAVTSGRSKRKKREQVNLVVNADEASAPEKRKEKRKRHENDTGTDEIDQKSTKKRNKRTEESIPVGNGDTTGGVGELTQKRSKKKKSKREGDTTQENVVKSEVEPSRKKLDKKSSRKSEEESWNDSVSSLPNPREDATLTDKACAALSYACSRVSSAGTWKFNKAHQIWIVKHLFTDDSIPERYVPIVVDYLAGCQGGVRENLIQACNKLLEPTALSSETAATSISTPDEPSRPSSRNTIQALPKVENVAVSPETQEALKTRAIMLLKALENTSG